MKSAARGVGEGGSVAIAPNEGVDAGEAVDHCSAGYEDLDEGSASVTKGVGPG